jgi:hypothetical protein
MVRRRTILASRHQLNPWIKETKGDMGPDPDESANFGGTISITLAETAAALLA